MTLLFLFDEDSAEPALVLAQQQYHRAAVDLLPPGRAWNRILTSQLGKLVGALQWENARWLLDLRKWVLETVPATAVDMLPEWEALVGIPDDCFPVRETVAERQAQLITKFRQTTDQSEPSYKQLAAAVGYDIEISSYQLFRGERSGAGDKAYDETTGKFAKVVTAESAADDTLLQCVLDAHAHIYGRLDYNLWDESSISALTGLAHHYVHGEFTRTTDLTKVTAWTNRVTSANGWASTGVADADRPIVVEEQFNVGGVGALGLWDDASATYELRGLNIAEPGSEDTLTLFNSDEFNLFLVVELDEVTLGNTSPFDNHIILADVSGNDLFCLAVRNVLGRPELQFRFNNGVDQDLVAEAVTGRPFLIEIDFSVAVDGAVLTRDDDDGDSDLAGSGIAVTGQAALQLGKAGTQGLPGSVLEMVACDYSGSLLTVDPAILNVRNYLSTKYSLELSA